jgi:hypothetical protein
MCPQVLLNSAALLKTMPNREHRANTVTAVVRHRKSFLQIVLSVFQPPVVKRWQCSFKNIQDNLIDVWFLDCPGKERKVMFARFFVHRNMNNLFSVGHDGEVWVVGHENDLPPLFRLFDECDQNLVNAFVVKIVFWLINDKRNILPIEHQIKYKQQPAAFAGG